MTRGIALCALGVLALAAPAMAEHEVFYRFTVLGFVKDERGEPVRDTPVEVVRDKTGLSYPSETDAEGFYIIVVRLGDESLGEQLTVQVAEQRSTVTVQFDPANHADERGTRIDVEGVRLIERRAWFRSTLARALGDAGR